jgi:hypothetical protein
MARRGERRVALAVAAAAFWRELGFEEALMRRPGGITPGIDVAPTMVSVSPCGSTTLRAETGDVEEAY